MTTGPEHVLAHANAAMRELGAMSPAAIGAPLNDSLSAQFGPAFKSLLDNVYKSGVTRPDYLLISAGNDANWSCTVWPILDDAHQSEGLVISIRDVRQDEIDAALHRDVAERMLISAMRQGEEAQTAVQLHDRLYGEALAEKKAAETTKESQSETLRNVSHDLRTPLNAISGYLELLELGVYGAVTAPQRGALERLRESQQYLLVLVNEVLQFDMVHARKTSLSITDVAVPAAVADATSLLEAMFAKKGLVYQGNPCASAMVARADPYRLKQILVNLLTNALKFTDAGGLITTICEETPDRIMLSVTDTGVGIPAAKHEDIFEPFVQVSAGTQNWDGRQNSEKGFGLGLAISRQLARQMNGDLTVQSVLGKGSRFTLTLPRAI